MVTLITPTASEAVAFISERHYSGTATAGVARHGWLNDDGELVAVSVYDNGNHDMRNGVFGANYAKQVLHHQRLAVDESVPHGLTSMFLAASLRKLHRDKPSLLAVVSYADWSVGHRGTIYQACNALYTGLTTKGNLYFRTENNEVRTMQGLKAHGSWSERRSEAKRRGWTEHRSMGKHRYVFLLGAAKKGRPPLLWDTLPYPKTELTP